MVNSLFPFPGFFFLAHLDTGESIQIFEVEHRRMLIPKCPEIGIGQWESQGRVRSTVEIIYLRKKRTLML